VPVYLFLLWIALALYTLDGLSRFLSLSYTNRQILGSSRPRKKRRRRENEEEERDAGRRIRKELSSVVVVVLLD
jgi:hypothetical protein